MIEAIKQLFGFGPKVDYADLVKNGAMILDVRSKHEFSSGHIRGSVNISLSQLPANLPKLKDKDKPIIACCASGARSSAAKRILKSNGYTQVYNGGSWMSLKNKI